MSRFSAITLALLLVCALAACSSPAASSAEPEPTQAQESQAAEPSESAAESAAAAGEETIRIDGSQFDPPELTISVGTEVSWVNADSFGHTVTEGTDGTPVDDPIIDEDIAQNATVSVTFDEPGTYEITCRIHPSMQMTITVEG